MEGTTLTTVWDMLMQVWEQTTALWEGQTWATTNKMLDKLQQSRTAPQDNIEIVDWLHHIETLIQMLCCRPQLSDSSEQPL